jgi:hypothetical protein
VLPQPPQRHGADSLNLDVGSRGVWHTPHDVTPAPPVVVVVVVVVPATTPAEAGPRCGVPQLWQVQGPDGKVVLALHGSKETMSGGADVAAAAVWHDAQRTGVRELPLSSVVGAVVVGVGTPHVPQRAHGCSM